MVKDLLCIGHRGAMGHAPENTLASFARALALGAPCVELDVQAVDGRLLVFHDDRLERCTNGRGTFAEASFEALRALDAGNGERIPTLEEVLALIAGRAGVNIELKGPGTVAPVAAFLAQRRADGDPNRMLLVSSFDLPRLRELRTRDPDVRIALLCRRWSRDSVPDALRLGAWAIHLAISQANPGRVAEVQAAGLRCHVYTANQPVDIARLREMGVDGVFSDFPERVLQGNSGELPPGWH